MQALEKETNLEGIGMNDFAMFTLYQLPRRTCLVGEPLSMPKTNGTPTAVTGLRGIASNMEKRSAGIALQLGVGTLEAMSGK